MKWQIPAKTFLLGEYAALAGASAIVVTTSPCFEIALAEAGDGHGIHPDSPAGRWWAKQAYDEYNLVWHDPYQGQGGLGASSAQFLGAYLAGCYLSQQHFEQDALLTAYAQSAWQGQGLQPSGYDVLAQSQHQCVYINRRDNHMTCYEWPFPDLAFVLVHSGQKLATHHHLQDMILPERVWHLSAIVDQAKEAFEEGSSLQLIEAINAYHHELSALQLTTSHTQSKIAQLRAEFPVLAAKGCGAMGADVILLIIPRDTANEQIEKIKNMGLMPLASNMTLHAASTIQINTPKDLKFYLDPVSSQPSLGR